MKSRINCPFTVSFGTNRHMLLTSLPRCVIALGWSLHSCPSMPLRQTVHTCSEPVYVLKSLHLATPQPAQTQKLKTGRAFAAEVRRSNIHPSVHKLTAWRKRNRLSQR